MLQWPQYLAVVILLPPGILHRYRVSLLWADTPFHVRIWQAATSIFRYASLSSRVSLTPPPTSRRNYCIDVLPTKKLAQSMRRDRHNLHSFFRLHRSNKTIPASPTIVSIPDCIIHAPEFQVHSTRLAPSSPDVYALSCHVYSEPVYTYKH